MKAWEWIEVGRQLEALVFWARFTALFMAAACLSIVGEKLFAIYKLKESSRHFEAGSYMVGAILKGFAELFPKNKPTEAKKNGAHAGTRADGVRKDDVNNAVPGPGKEKGAA